jgi:hypothetical protein
MRTRKHRRHSEAQRKETPFFSTRRDKANAEGNLGDGFFQPKLIMGKSGDRFEQEADRAADGVVNQARHNANDVTGIRRKAKVRRQTEEKEEPGKGKTEETEEPVEAQAEEKEEPVKAKAEEKEEPVEAQPEEKEEPVEAQAEEKEEPVEAQAEEKEEPVEAQEEKEEPVEAQADEKEEPVTAEAEEKQEPVEAQEEKKEEPVEAKGEEEEQIQAKPAIQPKPGDTTRRGQSNGEDRSGKPDFAARLRQQLGKGRPLPDKVRSEMESSLDADFSAVRIHTDEEAVQLSKMLKAQAFTRGNDVFFNQGKFDPGTRAGKHLLAHELTHVKQQKGR